MKKNFLTVALGVAIATIGASSSAMAKHADSPAFAASTAHLIDVRYITLADIPSALASTGNAPAHWHGRTMPRNNPMSADEASQVAWISSTALASEEARRIAVDMIRDGQAVLVSVVPGAPRHDVATFGVKADGDTIMYRQRNDGSLDIYSIDNAATGRGSQDMVDHVLGTLADDSAKNAIAKDEDIRGPYREFHVEKPSPTGNGASTRMTIRVARDSSTNRDNKVVSVHSVALARPFRNGITDTGWPRDNTKDSQFRASGEGRMLYTAGVYELKTIFAWSSNDDVDAVKTSHFPTHTGSTDIDFRETRSRTTQFDWGMSSENSSNLKMAGEDWLGKSNRKIGGGIGGGWQNTSKDDVSMKFKDFSIDVKESNVSGANWRGQLVQVDFPMAQTMRKDDYFYSKKGYVKADKMTPMMRTGEISSLVEWKIPGSYEGTITIATAPLIQDFVWNENVGPSSKLDWPLSSQAPVIPKDTYFPDATQPVASVDIDMGSPYLTRMPTILIQSKAHDNKCLSVPSGETGARVVPCDHSDGSRHQQWVIDDLGRYVHRATGKCLVGRLDAKIETCGNSLEQKWEWRNDRLHSKTGDGMTRLQVLSTISDKVFTNYDSTRNDPLPNNPTHILLKPWSTYPIKPTMAAHIPGFNHQMQPVPEHYLSFREVSGMERWQTIPYIYGLSATPR